MKKLFILLLLLTGVQFSSTAQLNYVYQQRLNKVFDSVCNTFKIKGVTAAINVPGEGLWERCHGVSHGNVAINSDMYMGIGSNTKTFYSVLLLKLQEQGKLSLDDTIGTWIQNQPNIPGHITIRQLLNHTSGLYSFTNNSDMNTYILTDFTRVWPPDSILNLVKAPVAAPGGSFDYCNTNYVLAGMIASAVTGKTAHQALRDEILTPQGLSETYLFPYETPPGTIAHSWSSVLSSGNHMEDMIGDNGYSHNAMFSLAYSAGAIMSTARDNAKFWYKLMSGSMLNSSSMTELETLVPVATGIGYGLGIYSYVNYNGRNAVSHGGTNIGFINDNIHDKSNNVTITLLTNQDSIGNHFLLNFCIKALHKVTMQYTDVNSMTIKDNKINIYPNPVKDVLHINMQASAIAQLYNITGQLQQTTTLSRGVNNIDVSQLSSGTYFLSITGDDHTQRQTIQVVH